MFVWNKSELNKDQEKAILTDDSVLLIACPGSGKTRTLTYKVAYELDRLQSNREFVVAITYTNNAADEIKERIELLGVDTTQLWIGTIHAFCIEWILRPYAACIEQLKYGFSIINPAETEAILAQLCEPYRRERISVWDCKYMAAPKGMMNMCPNGDKRKIVRNILKEYFKIINQENRIDFEQVLCFAHKILQKKPVVGAILSNLFPFILVDEYQDTKEIQYHIIANILKPNKGKSKLLIVGDPNQSIYKSMGGMVMEKKELETLLGFPLKQQGLTYNYRSSAKIIEYFENYKIYDNNIEAAGSHKDFDSTITFDFVTKFENLTKEIVRLINYNIKERNISPDQICIVAPWWIQLSSMTKALMIVLPDYSFNGPGMAPFAKDIDNFWYKLSRIILTEPAPHLYIKRLRWSSEILYELEQINFDVTKHTSKGFLRLCNSISIDESDGIDYLKEAFSIVLQKIKLNIENYPSLKKHHQSFFTTSKKRINRLLEEGNKSIDTVESFRKVFKQKEGITISTIHGVKGEEYDTVIGFALLEGVVPFFYDNDKENNANRMLYVLGSRARKNLHLIAEKGRFNSKKKEYKPTDRLLKMHYKYDKI